MDLVGDDDRGFSVAFDAETNTVHVRAWGFWTADVASVFCKTVGDACRHRKKGAILAMDMRELKPMRDEGQESFGALVALLPSLGIVRTSVETSSHLIKLQLLRISTERGAKGSVHFT